MTNRSRTERIAAAAEICQVNAADTVIDKFGIKAVREMDFNTHLNAVTEEKISQASYFADEYGVTTAEVLSALGIEVTK